MPDRPILAPSILSADFTRLGEQVTTVVSAGARWIHIDVMDGVFVPNITIGPLGVRALSPVTTADLDVHLMITHPQNHLEAFAEAGASLISVHVEAEPHLHRCIQKIRDLGCRAGVALNPATPLGHLEAVLPYVDLILIMSVNPGFGGQRFIPESIERVRSLARMRADSDGRFLISVDGGVNHDNAVALAEAGADVLVAGSSVFSTNDPAASVRQFLNGGDDQ